MNIKQILNTAVGGYSLSKILSALVTLLVCLIAVRLIMKVVTRLLSRMQKVNERLQKVIRTSAKVLLYVLTVIITAEALGVNTSSLTALLSVLTLGITLAAEDILGNVAGGLVILSVPPLRSGGLHRSRRHLRYCPRNRSEPHEAGDRQRSDDPDAQQGPLLLQDHQLYRSGPTPDRPDRHCLL